MTTSSNGHYAIFFLSRLSTVERSEKIDVKCEIESRANCAEDSLCCCCGATGGRKNKCQTEFASHQSMLPALELVLYSKKSHFMWLLSWSLFPPIKRKSSEKGSDSDTPCTRVGFTSSFFYFTSLFFFSFNSVKVNQMTTSFLTRERCFPRNRRRRVSLPPENRTRRRRRRWWRLMVSHLNWWWRSCVCWARARAVRQSAHHIIHETLWDGRFSRLSREVPSTPQKSTWRRASGGERCDQKKQISVIHKVIGM